MPELRFHPVASTTDLSADEMKPVTVGERTFALYNVGGRYFATEAYCSHGHALLTEGYIEGETVECPMHGGSFEIATGKPVGAPCTTPIATYAVRIDDGAVLLGIPDETEN